jgi:hypothetical protein
VRVNPREYFDEARNAIGIVFKDQTHAIGRNIHKRDTPARIVHAIGIFAIIAITTVVFWAAEKFTLDAHLEGTWLTLRWITGLIGLGSIAAVITYPGRKQIYTRRAGPLRYWKLAHAYLGLLAGIVLLIHGGPRFRRIVDFAPDDFVRCGNRFRNVWGLLLLHRAPDNDQHRGRSFAH